MDSTSDHPRSRGEYRLDTITAERDAGSSPLSRGILGWGCGGSAGAGIIPALAGNTESSHSPPIDRGDHPRSRGEYSLVGGVGVVEKDHPRSRGEYPMPATKSTYKQGSSPLSRGIQGQG